MCLEMLLYMRVCITSLGGRIRSYLFGLSKLVGIGAVSDTFSELPLNSYVFLYDVICDMFYDVYDALYDV